MPICMSSYYRLLMCFSVLMVEKLCRGKPKSPISCLFAIIGDCEVLVCAKAWIREDCMCCKHLTTSQSIAFFRQIIQCIGRIAVGVLNLSRWTPCRAGGLICSSIVCSIYLNCTLFTVQGIVCTIACHTCYCWDANVICGVELVGSKTWILCTESISVYLTHF